MKRWEDCHGALITLTTAKRRKLTIDWHCVPPIAYKGSRFDSDEWYRIYQIVTFPTSLPS